MKYFYAFLASFLIVLAGCGKDPIVADIEAFNELGRSVFQDVNVSSLNQKMSQAKTNEERAAAIDDFVKLMESKSEKMSAFKAKTPEVGKIAEAFSKGLSQSVEGAKHAKAAMLAANPMELNAASTEMMAAQRGIVEAANELTKLAKEKGVKIK